MRRSRAYGRHFKRAPSGKVVVRLIKKKSVIHRCGRCGRPLAGIGEPKKPKSCKRPNRPYGGYLCSRCTREELRRRVRQESLATLK
jgi:large subunit ribosomal protein L34e